MWEKGVEKGVKKCDIGVTKCVKPCQNLETVRHNLAPKSGPSNLGKFFCHLKKKSQRDLRFPEGICHSEVPGVAHFDENLELAWPDLIRGV